MRWMVLILGLFLSGCYAHYHQPRYQGPPPLQATSMAQVDAMVGAQQPAAYKVGFMEGCDSGRLSAGDNSFLFKKDTNRFDTDDVYKQGWNDGFNRCVSGNGIASNNYYYPSYYRYDYYYPGYYYPRYYYPGTFYSGFYYPSYYYAPGYSLWLGYYGYSHHTHYAHNHYYYTPWYGGHRHRGGGKFYSSRRGHKGHSGGPYINPGGYGKSHKKGRGGKSRGGRSGGSWIR